MARSAESFGSLRRRGFTRREIAAGLVSAAGIGAMGALSSRDLFDDEEGPEGPLVMLADRDESFGAQREALVRLWNRLHPRYEVELRELPRSADLQYSGVHAVLQARNSAVDVVNLDIPWIAEFVAEERLRPLEHLRDAGFLEAPWEAGVVDGKVYALPFNTDVGLLYYRKDLVEDDPSDWDWDQFARSAKSLMGDEGVRAKAPGLEGAIAMQLAPYEGFTVNVWEALLSNGAEPVRQDLIQVADDRATIATFSRLRGLLGDGTIAKSSLEFDEARSLEAFQEGRSIFLRHWPNAYFQLLACEAVDFPVGIAPMPGVGVLGGQSLAVSAYSRAPVAAQALVEFLTGPRSQQVLFERGGFAATRPEPYEDAHLRSGAGDDAAIQSVPEKECISTGVTRGFPLPGVTALETGLREAGTRPAVERYTRFSEVFREHVHAAFDQDEDVDAEALQEELEAAVEGR